MRVLIRADSGKEIGFGHISRCLMVSKALKDDVAEVSFDSKNHHGNSTKKIKNVFSNKGVIVSVFVKISDIISVGAESIAVKDI